MEHIQINAVGLSTSDSRKLEDDLSGAALVGLLLAAGAHVVERQIVEDDRVKIAEALRRFSDSGDVNLILTTGGTGFSPRDNTPEATLDAIDREAPGIAEAIRRETASKTASAMLSRGVAGIRGATLIINFPGSPKAVKECFSVIEKVLPHAIDLITGKNDHGS
jgi:molybdenum cofactor synthesis domain-containing protein